MKTNIEKALQETFFLNREKNFSHTTYDVEMLQYETLKRGEDEAIPLGKQAFESAEPHLLSKDKLRGWKYMFVASTTIICRYAMDGGMDSEMSYNLSDLFIQRADLCNSVQEIFDLHDEMVRTYTAKMKDICRNDRFSVNVLHVMDYVTNHLHDRITLEELAEYTAVTPSYLSAVFKKETGMTISDYIRRTKIEAAMKLLQYYDDLSATEIGEYLAFSSASHFTKVFREETGMTPKEYRKKHYRKWKEDGVK